MQGIDIASWQNGLDFHDVNVDFGIIKATEGTYYTNPCCDSWVTQLIEMGKPFGVYHFCNCEDPHAEAEYFYRECTGYIGKGIFVLDFETFQVDARTWCERFMQHFHDLSGIWPLLYVSASRLEEYNGSWIPDKCGLWLAGYPQTYTSWTDDALPYDVYPWDFAAIWQFTSSLIVPGWHAKLDGDIAYMDETAWMKYAGSNTSIVQPALSYKQLAAQIVKGQWGNGKEREKRLRDAGYDYDTAQEIVNAYYGIAAECIQGVWGNGWNRKNALEASGYDYDAVQLIVNEMMK